MFPCEKIRAVLRLLIISNKFVRQSRHIGTLTKMVFVVWVGFSPHLLQDLFVFKASLATLKRTTVCPTTKVISDRQGKLFSCTFVGISTYFISDPRRSLFMQCDCKYLRALKERVEDLMLETPPLSHLRNPVKPDGEEAHRESLYESEK